MDYDDDIDTDEQEGIRGHWDSILLDSFALVHGNRGDLYGPPWEDYARVTRLFNSMWGEDVLTAEGGILFMVCIKLGRIAHGLEQGFPPELLHDSIVDAAGYLDCLWGSMLNPPVEYVEEDDDYDEDEDED